MKQKGISGSTLKIMAMASMVLDHTAAVLLAAVLIKNGIYSTNLHAPEYYRELLSAGNVGIVYIGYQVIREVIGRIAFPIFCFLLVEGFQRTRNQWKYAGRMFAFALISEVPFDLAFHGAVWYGEDQNVFFTLLIGLLVLIGMKAAEQRIRCVWLMWLSEGLLVLAGAQAAFWLCTDYDYKGILAIAMLYLFRREKTQQLLAGCVSFIWEPAAPLAFIPIAFYNGKRGLDLKYFFYFFYPAHLLVLYLIIKFF